MKCIFYPMKFCYIGGGGRITFFRLPAILRKYNPDHSLSPTGYQIDLVTMIQDIAMGKSKTEVMKKK